MIVNKTTIWVNEWTFTDIKSSLNIAKLDVDDDVDDDDNDHLRKPYQSHSQYIYKVYKPQPRNKPVFMFLNCPIS